MKLKDLIFEQDNQVAAAAKAINNAITSIDDSMHYGVFAKAIAHILKDEYGSHNFNPFMEVLHKELGMNEEAVSESTKTTDLEGLTWDLITSTFGKVPMFGFHLPNPDDSSRMAFDEADLEDWKKGIMKKYGNVNIKIDTEASAPFERIQVLDDKFIADKKSRIKGKAAWLDKERELGRSTD